MKSLSILTCFVLSVTSAADVATIGVYYESKCPDSMDFVENQLGPTYTALNNYITVDFVPFGKASWEIGSDGKYQFDCQHGERECLGNKIQACLLDRLERNADEVSVITCIMSQDDPPAATEQCIRQTGVPVELSNILACAETDEGSKLLVQMGERTNKLDPPLNFVPWIMFNNVHDEEDQNASLVDLKKVLCTKYLAGVPACG